MTSRVRLMPITLCSSGSIIKYCLIIFALFVFGGVASAQVNAASCNSSDVQTAINNATAGQTVNVPAGNCTWTANNGGNGAISYCKNITLAGAGVGSTVITVNIAGSPNFGYNAIFLNGCSGTLGRVTGFTFQNQLSDSLGVIFVKGSSPVSLRIDHNAFLAVGGFYGRAVTFSSPCASPGCLIDHNTIIDEGVLVENIIKSDSQPGATAWTQATPFETVNAVYFENNTLTYPNFAVHETDIDCDDGGAYVFRYNSVTGNAVGNHGYDSVPNGCIMMDVYNNTLNANSVAPWAIQYRGGMGVDYDNIINGTATITQFGVTDYRSTSGGFTGHGYCDGTGAEDQNAAPMTTNYGGHCYEQVGTGAPASSFTSYPIYEWDNCTAALGCAAGGANQITISVYAAYGGTNYLPYHIVANRDYYDQVASFNGTAGVGRGALASRPSTCAAKVAYWATDTNTLYQCRSSNNWTAYYTPYTYPHPLQGGGGTAPAPPTGLTATTT